MDDADQVRLEGLEMLCRDLVARNKVLWRQKAEAQSHADNYRWLRDVWWSQRKPDLSEYAADELDAAIAAYRQGKTPPPSRRSKFDEWSNEGN